MDAPDAATMVAELKREITEQNGIQGARSLIKSINANCFERCVSSGSTISSKEDTCLSTCMNKFMQGHQVVAMEILPLLRKPDAMRVVALSQ